VVSNYSLPLGAGVSRSTNHESEIGFATRKLFANGNVAEIPTVRVPAFSNFAADMACCMRVRHVLARRDFIVEESIGVPTDAHERLPGLVRPSSPRPDETVEIKLRLDA
jgi:hypothetical protein